MPENISLLEPWGQPKLDSCPRILVVDDDGDLRRLNHEILTLDGNSVDDAEDGAAAWEALQRKRYDLLVTDYNMPKLSGIELLKKVHAAQLPLPVIMVAAVIPTWEFSTRPWLQPAAMVFKPYSLADFLRTVKAVLFETDNFRKPMPSPVQRKCL